MGVDPYAPNGDPMAIAEHPDLTVDEPGELAAFEDDASWAELVEDITDMEDN